MYVGPYISGTEDYGIDIKITTLFNEIYDTGHIPPDMISKSLFIALPKKPECELHRKISLMSRITKLLLRITIMRVRNKIKTNTQIVDEQRGFVEGKGSTNLHSSYYISRFERALEVQKEV